MTKLVPQDHAALHTICEEVPVEEITSAKVQKVIKASGKREEVGEGCLSVPDHYGIVSRAKNCTIRAYDEHGKLFERGAGGLLAQIFQHECDHLDGMLFDVVAAEVMHKSKIKKTS